MAPRLIISDAFGIFAHELVPKQTTNEHPATASAAGATKKTDKEDEKNY